MKIMPRKKREKGSKGITSVFVKTAEWGYK
jgi:hypothetical protein